MKGITGKSFRAAVMLTVLLLAIALVGMYEAAPAKAMSPSGTVWTTGTTIGGYASDQADGLNIDSWAVSLDGVTLTGGPLTYLGNDTWQSGQCTISAWEYDEWLGFAQSDVSCSVTGLSLGTHTMTSSITSYGGYVYNDGGSFVVSSDSTPPTVSSVLPTGTISTTSATVGVYYSDSQSGVNPASVNVTLDGGAISGCAVNASSASCNVYGLANGGHTIGGSVSDVSGNTSSISGSFSVAGPPPSAPERPVLAPRHLRHVQRADVGQDRPVSDLPRRAQRRGRLRPYARVDRNGCMRYLPRGLRR